MRTATVPAVFFSDEKLGIKTGEYKKIIAKLEMVEFEKAKDTWSMSEDEKIEFGNARKEVGSELFRKGRTALALERYKKVCDLFNYIDNFKEENKTKAKELKKLSELNQAACHLKLKNVTDAKKACNNVLKEERENVKALYRRAQCDFELKNFMDCMTDLKKVINLDPQNKPARALLKDAQLGQKDEDKKSKGLFANMCKALGKGPIPPPGKDANMVPGMDDDDEDDEDMDEPPKAEEEPAKAEEPTKEEPSKAEAA